MLKVEVTGLDEHQATLLRIFAQSDSRLNKEPGDSKEALESIRSIASADLGRQGIFTGYDATDEVYTYIRG